MTRLDLDHLPLGFQSTALPEDVLGAVSLALGRSPFDPRRSREALDRDEGAALREVERRRRASPGRNPGLHEAPSRRIEARAVHLGRNHEPEPTDRCAPVPREIVIGRAQGHVGTAHHLDPTAGAGRAQDRKHGLEHQGDGAGGADLEAKLSRGDRARLEPQVGRAVEGPAHFRPAGHGHRPHRGEVLRLKTRARPTRPDSGDLEALAGERRQGERAAEHLASALSGGPVEGDEGQAQTSSPSFRGPRTHKGATRSATLREGPAGSNRGSAPRIDRRPPPRPDLWPARSAATGWREPRT